MAPIQISVTLAGGPNRRIIARAREHAIQMDVHKERGGEDTGPTPLECLAMALGGCVMNMTRIIARDRGIRLSDIKMVIRGDIDPSRAFGFESTARAGFSDLSIALELIPEPAESDREQLLQELYRRCPLCDTISDPTPLRITFV